MSSISLVERISSECDLSDDVTAMGSADGFTAVIRPETKGDEVEEFSIEVVSDDAATEVSIFHTEMPGRLEAKRMNRGEEPDIFTEIPSPVGVLRFDELDDAIPVIESLADEDVISDLVDDRNFVARNDSLSVAEAIASHEDIDDSDVIGTLTSV